MTGRRGHEHRVPQQLAYTILQLSHIERVCDEEGVPVPDEVRRAAATVRNWCREVGATYRDQSRL
jgi:hypothetical protein